MPRRSNSSTSVVVCETFTTNMYDAMCSECPSCIAYMKLLTTGDCAYGGAGVKRAESEKGRSEKGSKKAKK